MPYIVRGAYRESTQARLRFGLFACGSSSPASLRDLRSAACRDRVTDSSHATTKGQAAGQTALG